ncbi:MAG: hypothetical protein M3P48_06210 [Actinomycetota bacterium]|nr:hypothetical protein [Actinomycetota bacterium]
MVDTRRDAPPGAAPPPAPAPHGSLGEEAARLVQALQEWAERRAGFDAHAAAQCRGCPFCSTLTRLRAVRPEAVTPVVDAAVALVRTVGDLVASGRNGEQRHRSGDGDGDRV